MVSKQIYEIDYTSSDMGGATGAILLMAKYLVHSEDLFGLSQIKYLANSVIKLWYLYATFFSAVIIGFLSNITSKLCDAILVFIAILIHFIPTDIFWLSFSFEFILLGFFIRKYNLKYSNIKKWVVLLSILYIVLLIFFKYDYSVYVAGSNYIRNSPFTEQLFYNTFRYIMGVLGSIFVGSILHLLYSKAGPLFFWIKIKDSISNIGACSLEMYVTQYVVVEVLFSKMMSQLSIIREFITSNSYACYFLWRHLIGTILIIITYIICKKIKGLKVGKYLY